MGYRRTIHHPGQVACYWNSGNLFPIRIPQCSTGFATLFVRCYWKSMASTQGQCTVRKLPKFLRMDFYSSSATLTPSSSECEKTPCILLCLLCPFYLRKGDFQVDVILAVLSNLRSGPSQCGVNECQSGVKVGGLEYRRSNKSSRRLPGSLFSQITSKSPCSCYCKGCELSCMRQTLALTFLFRCKLIQTADQKQKLGYMLRVSELNVSYERD